MNVAMSDGFCAREEALLLVALRLSLTLGVNYECRIVSIDTSSVYIDPTQILYVESDFDNDVNWEINEKFREIMAEVRLAGFDLVYLPKIAEHYRTISDSDLLSYKIPCSGVISRPAASTSCRSFFITSAGIHLRSTLTVRTRLRLRTMSIGA